MSETTATTTWDTPKIESRLRRAQAIAGSLFAIFVLLHLSNIALAPLGIEIFNGYQQTIQKFYQQPVIELLIVLGPLIAHAIAGIWLFLLRRSNPATHQRPWHSRLHSWAGCLLLLFIIGTLSSLEEPHFSSESSRNSRGSPSLSGTSRHSSTPTIFSWRSQVFTTLPTV